MDNNEINKDGIEATYCFFHQKLRVYEYSTNPDQRDDIEYAIAQYVDGMNPALYRLLAEGRADYLLDHTRFEQDMKNALQRLEGMM